MSYRPTLSKEAILNYVGAASFQKGENYASHRAISQGKLKSNVLKAVCQGHTFDPYSVEAILSEKGVHESYCSCPVGAGGKCKHVAALLLTWQDHPDEFIEWDVIRNHLKSYDSPTLLELIDLLEDKIKDSPQLIQSFQHNLQHLHSPQLAKYFKRIEEAFQVAKSPRYRADAGGIAEISFALEKVRVDVENIESLNPIDEKIRVYQAIIQQILAYLDEHRDYWGSLAEEIKACVFSLDQALTQVSEDKNLRHKIFRILFSLIEEQTYRDDPIAAEEAKKVILQHISAEERAKVVSWVDAVRVNQEGEEESPLIEDFLIDLQKDQLNPEVYLFSKQAIRSTSLYVGWIDGVSLPNDFYSF